MPSFFQLLSILSIIAQIAIADNRLSVVVAIPLTGGLSEYGEALKNGVELAKEEDPQIAEHIHFLYEDNRYDNATSLTIFRKYQANPKVALAYFWGYGPNQAVVPVAERNAFPFLAATGEDGVNIGMKHVIRFCFRIDQLSEAIMHHLRLKGIKRIGIVKSEVAFMNSTIDGMRKRLQSDELLDIIESFQVQDYDFRTTIEKLKVKKYDAIGVFLLSGQNSQFYRESYNLRFKSYTFGSTPFENLSELKLAGRAMEGSVFPTLAINPAFEKRYIDRYGNNVQVSWAANAYDFAKLVGGVFVRRTPSRSDVLSFLKRQELPDGAQGSITYLEDPVLGNRFNLGVVMKQVNANSITALSEPIVY